MLAALALKEGNTLHVIHSDDNGLKIQAYDPELLGALAVSEEIMDENTVVDGVNYSSGVLKLDFNSAEGKKTYVLNKQAPNQRLWLSSPFSGP